MAPSSETASSDNSTIFYLSIILFAVVSYLLYKFVLSAALTQPPTPSSTGTVVTQRNAIVTSSSGTAISANSSAENDEYFSYGAHRHPPHLIAPDKWDKSTSLSKYLLQGVVPFRSTPANGYETRLQKQLPEEDLIVANRKERARIFARLFSLATTEESQAKKPPPNRGANIVVTIYPPDVSCVKLQKALMLLGTYYNLFVLVDGSGIFQGNSSEKQKQHREYIRNFREELLQSTITAEAVASTHKLNSQILPPHRIVFLTTTAGRVAFVRQLHGVELVVDGDEKVTKELERFNHRVLLYPREGNSDGTSALGKFLVP